MFADRKVKKLEKTIESAAIELTIAEKVGPPPDGHAGARRAVQSAAAAAVASGDGEAVQRILSSADKHPMFRGDNKQPWLDFVAAVRDQL